MKLTKKYLEQLIKEECGAMMPDSVSGGSEAEIVVDDEVEPAEGTDIEGLAHRAIAAIYDLATAAGVTLSIDAGADDDIEDPH